MISNLNPEFYSKQKLCGQGNMPMDYLMIQFFISYTVLSSPGQKWEEAKGNKNQIIANNV